MATFDGKQVNQAQLHAELEAGNTVPAGWGLKGEAFDFTELANGRRVPVTGVITDVPKTLPDAVIQAAVDAHVADWDWGIDPDRLKLRDTVLGRLDTAIANVGSANNQQLRQMVELLLKVARMQVRDLHVEDPSASAPTPD